MITNQRMEKWVVRKSFEDYLPKEVAWRQKEHENSHALDVE